MRHFKNKRLNFKKLSIYLSDKKFGLSPKLKRQFSYVLGTKEKRIIKHKLGI